MNRNIYHHTPPYKVAVLQSRATRNVLEFRDDVLKEYGLTSPEWCVLGYVREKTEGGGVRVGDIAAMLDVQSTYITGMLRKLEAKELVQWLTDQEDRRARIITATKKGTAVAGAVETELIKREAAWLGKLPDAHIKGYLHLLELQARMDDAA